MGPFIQLGVNESPQCPTDDWLVRVQTLHTSYFIFLLSVRAQVKLPDIASKSKRVHGLYITFTSLIFLNLLDSVGSHQSLCHVFVHVYQSPNTVILKVVVVHISPGRARLHPDLRPIWINSQSRPSPRLASRSGLALEKVLIAGGVVGQGLCGGR